MQPSDMRLLRLFAVPRVAVRRADDPLAARGHTYESLAFVHYGRVVTGMPGVGTNGSAGVFRTGTSL